MINPLFPDNGNIFSFSANFPFKTELGPSLFQLSKFSCTKLFLRNYKKLNMCAKSKHSY